MNVFEIISNRKTIRLYQKKDIPPQVVTEIVKAGIFGPAVVTFQPWQFYVILNKELIQKIAEITSRKVIELGIIGNTVLKRTVKAIATAPLVILVYNDNSFVKFANRFGKEYCELSKVAELSAIAAAIQNMILAADNLGIGSSWNDTPLFCEREINSLVKNTKKLIAVLTFGYPAEQGKRSARKSFDETVVYL